MTTLSILLIIFESILFLVEIEKRPRTFIMPFGYFFLFFLSELFLEAWHVGREATDIPSRFEAKARCLKGQPPPTAVSDSKFSSNRPYRPSVPFVHGSIQVGDVGPGLET